MSVATQAMVRVLGLHQWALTDENVCLCGERPGGQWPSIWMPRHQASELAAEGIFPFRPDHVESS